MSTMRAPHLLHGQPCCACGADARELCGELALAARAAHVPWRNRTCTSANELPELHSSGPPPLFCESLRGKLVHGERTCHGPDSVPPRGGEPSLPHPCPLAARLAPVRRGRWAHREPMSARSPPAHGPDRKCVYAQRRRRARFFSHFGLRFKVPSTVPYGSRT